jgi:cysteinyl-tRNA synthetase
MATYWMHNGYLTVNGEKMSKSLGNFFTVRDLLAEAPGEALRYFLLTGHYRAPLDFTRQGLVEAKAALDRLYGALRVARDSAANECGGQVYSPVQTALEDDLNTPLALSRLHGSARRLNTLIEEKRSPYLEQALGELKFGGGLMGLLQQDPEAWFRWQPAGVGGLDAADIEHRIKARLAARKAKNFTEADRIRKELLELGVALEDRPGGKTEWRRA